MKLYIKIAILAAGSLSSAAGLAASAENENAELIDAGRVRFAADCGFCHGRDTQGGSTGPDLTRSELVAEDVGGNLIGQVIREGRPDKGMPAVAISAGNLAAITAYIHYQVEEVAANNGGRRSVQPEDLLVGDARAGRAYFEENCTSCHSAEGDLAGIGSRQQGLGLIMTMLYPGRSAPAPQVTVITADGQEFIGLEQYQDEFTIAITELNGRYRSFRTKDVNLVVNDPLQAHVDQLPLYTDEDMHDVYAFLESLK